MKGLFVSVKIKCIDCLEGMAELPDNSIDMVLCDPPYGTTQNKWDSIIPLNNMWGQLNRVCRVPCPMIFCSNQPFTSNLVLSNISKFKYMWVWDKINRITGFLNSKKEPLRMAACIDVILQ